MHQLDSQSKPEGPQCPAGVAGLPIVFVVIPVFNRLALTRKCIHLLLRQTYRPIRIIVADGGSTDETPAAIRREFLAVTVLTSSRELWWAGAMAMGVEYVLRISADAGDFILMMNNDTEFDENYVATLVRVSQQRNAAVGALTVDARDPGSILDAGEFVDWWSYSFPVKTEVQPGEVFFDGVDVLPGRGSLVPISIVRQVGNIDSERFPHYIADYEYFARVKRHGFRLGVTYETTLKSDPTTTGMAARAGENRSLWQSAKLLLSRRSMNNFLDHYRFIGAAAPPNLVGAVRRRYVLGIIYRALRRLGLLRTVPHGLYLGAKSILWLIKPPYTVSTVDVKSRDLDLDWLTVATVLAPYIKVTASAGEIAAYYFLMGRNRAHLTGEAVGQLYEFALARGKTLKRSEVLRLIARRLHRVFLPFVWVTESDCEKFGLDPTELLTSGVLQQCGVKGHFILSSPNGKPTRQGARAAVLYVYAQKRKLTLRRLWRRRPETR